MPSLNADKLHKFLDIEKAKPEYIRILYYKNSRFILYPYQDNYWRVLMPNELINKLSLSRPRPRPSNVDSIEFIQNYGFF